MRGRQDHLQELDNVGVPECGVIVELSHQIFVDVLQFPRPEFYGHLHSFTKDIDTGLCCPKIGLLHDPSTAALAHVPWKAVYTQLEHLEHRFSTFSFVVESRASWTNPA
jgi:hypothetical protein